MLREVRAMAEKDHAVAEPPQRSGMGRWVLWAVVGLVLYVGSIGPVAALVIAHPPSVRGWNFVDTVYQPVVKFFQMIQQRDALYFYEFWWENRFGVEHGMTRNRRPGEGGSGVLILEPKW